VLGRRYLDPPKTPGKASVKLPEARKIRRPVAATQRCVKAANATNGHRHHAHIAGNRVMLLAFLFETIGRYFRYRSQLASINELDDRTLSDIGLNRGELRTTAWHLVDRAVWQ
jgi:uncharacterized protein YjiS (DUF1127 family)